ncbi:MAG: hypothetical protein ACM3X3_11695 [Betaproteobacteria bacterium]
MAQRSYFFDSVAGDRIYNTSDISRVLARLVGRDGVVYGYEGELKVSPTSPEGMSVAVAIGAAFVQGRLFEVYDLPETLAIAPADPTNPRIDRIVVRLDNSSAVRSVSLAVKAGTPAASPEPPTLQRDGTVWELSLAQVYVAAGATSISAANITDERSNELVCGYVPRTPDIVHRGAQKDMTGLSALLDLLWAPPAARVYHNAAQSIPNATWTTLAFNSERFDTDNIHDTATSNSRLTCKTAGKYLISLSLRFASNATGLRQAQVMLNGTTRIALVSQNPISGDPTIVNVSTVYSLSAGDYVEALAYQSSGGALDVEYAIAYSPEFMMVRVG